MDSFIDIEDVILRINLKMGNHSKYVVGLISHQRMKDAIGYVEGIEDNDYKQQCLYILARCNLYYESDNPDETYILSNSHIKDIYKRCRS